MSKHKVIIMLVFALLVTAHSFADENLTITTYYPSPYGVYKELRLFPSTQPTCDANHWGTLYYNSADNKVYVCKNTGWASLGGNYYAIQGTTCMPSDTLIAYGALTNTCDGYVYTCPSWSGGSCTAPGYPWRVTYASSTCSYTQAEYIAGSGPYNPAYCNYYPTTCSANYWVLCQTNF